MNHLVILDKSAGELEKILSGVKCMIVKEYDPAQSAGQILNPGDNLYFLRNNDEHALRVQATVVRVLLLTNQTDDDLSHVLKEMQTRLQLTEEQYNYWSARQQVMLVEFESAHKIGVIHVASNKITEKSNWIAFEDVAQIM